MAIQDNREITSEILYLNRVIAQQQDEIENLKAENENLKIQNKNQADLISLGLTGRPCRCPRCEELPDWKPEVH